MLDFVIIGAQKAASTWVVSTLGEHPAVFLPVQELPCFEHRYPDLDPLGGYPVPCGEHLKRGVKNNNLMVRPESPRLLFEHSPDIRIIASLRDPVDRLLSAYYWHMWVGACPVKPPEVGIEEALDTNDEDLLEPGFYARHLTRYLDLFESDQVFPILFEDIRDSPLETLKRTYAFLGLEPNFRPASLRSRPKTSVHSLSRIRWNSVRNKFILQRDTGMGGRILWKPNLSPVDRAANVILAGVDRFFLAPILSNRKPKLSPSLMRRIANVYRADCAALQDLIGRDLSHWTTLKLTKA